MGRIIVIVGPSFSGKTTIVSKLDIPKLITSTTRARRPNEHTGVDYYFMTKKQFEYGLEHHLFIEHVRYLGDYYGLSRQEVEFNIHNTSARSCIMDINGALKLKQLYPAHVRTVFIYTNLDILRNRAMLNERNDTPEIIEARLAKGKLELENSNLCDLIVYNNTYGAVDTCARIISEFLYI